MTPPAVETLDLRYTYPDGTEALGGVTLRIAPGTAIGLVGANGAGKSTLLLHLAGALVPAHGEVRINGVTPTDRTAAAVRRVVGLVFQNADDQLFMPTVFDDVAFGPLNAGLTPEAVEERTVAALRRVGMLHLRQRTSHNLSAGEKRAVAIATVLALEPDVLVMDEPSSSLDPRGRRRLIDLLRSFDHTRIIATHDLELVTEVCPRVFVMDAGRIVAEGQTAQILSDEALMLAHGLERPYSMKGRL